MGLLSALLVALLAAPAPAQCLARPAPGSPARSSAVETARPALLAPTPFPLSGPSPLPLPDRAPLQAASPALAPLPLPPALPPALAATSPGPEGAGQAPVATPGSPAVAPEPVDITPEEARLLEGLRLRDEHPAALESAKRIAKRLLASPNARHWAAQAREEGFATAVSFTDMPGVLVQEQGPEGPPRLAVRGSRGGYAPDVGVLLHRHYLREAEGGTFEQAPGILAHEWLGHGLWHHRAERAGVGLPFWFHIDNEVVARLSGWIVDAEGAGGVQDAEAARYLRDPAGWKRSLWTRIPAYAVSLDDAEFRAPHEVYRERLRALPGLREELRLQRQGSEVLAARARLAAAAQPGLSAALASQEQTHALEARALQGRIEELDHVEAELARLLRHPPLVPVWSPFFSRLQDAIARMTEHLARLMPAAPAPEAAPAS